MGRTKRSTKKNDERIHILVARSLFLQAEEVAKLRVSQETIDYLIITELNTAQAEKDQWDSIRLIREASYKAKELGASREVFDKILKAYLDAYLAIEGEYGFDPELCLRCIGHAQGIAKSGASKETVDTLYDLCIEKGFNLSAQMTLESIRT